MPFEPFTAGEEGISRTLSIEVPPSQPCSPITARSAWSFRTQPKVTISHKGVSVLFSDIVGFTSISHQLPPRVTMRLLHELFVTFDQINLQNDTYKVETIGDVSILLLTCTCFPLESTPLCKVFPFEYLGPSCGYARNAYMLVHRGAERVGCNSTAYWKQNTLYAPWNQRLDMLHLAKSESGVWTAGIYGCCWA